jgi:hypothetical protein
MPLVTFDLLRVAALFSALLDAPVRKMHGQAKGAFGRRVAFAHPVNAFFGRDWPTTVTCFRAN